MTAPAGLVLDVVSAAQAERERFLQFAARLGVAPDLDAVFLYLVHVLDTEQPSGRQLRARLMQLDRAAGWCGEPGLRGDARLQQLLLGLHAAASLGPIRHREPLYTEDVVRLLDVIAADRSGQLREIALLRVAHVTGLPAVVLQRLTWRDLRLRRQQAELTVAHRPGAAGPRGVLRIHADEHPATFAALRAYRSATGRGPGPLFVDSLSATHRFAGRLHDLPGRGVGWNRGLVRDRVDEHEIDELVCRAGQPTPRQYRDQALVLLGFVGCLDASEVRDLRVADVEQIDSGLLVQVRGRGRGVAVPAGVRAGTCAVSAWRRWSEVLERHGRAAGDAAAFPRLDHDRSIRPSPGPGLAAGRLSELVAAMTSAAGLPGHYSWSSLRAGCIRSALRAGARPEVVMDHAGMRTLKGATLHQAREQLISHSVLHRLGL